MKKQALIIDTRKELSTKYKKLIESLDTNVKISSKLDEALKIIQEFQPDLILVSDSIKETLSEFCQKLRILTFNSRPIIVALSKSAETEDRIQVLQAGADDFLSEPINSEEFKVRIMAHLRREFESNLNIKTMLPQKETSMKFLKRVTSQQEMWACLYISIDNLESYKEIYTELAADKLIQTYCAIINSAIQKDDYVGHISDTDFLIITKPIYAEKIASFLVFAFDAVAQKFYSKIDAKRGYTILQGDEKAGKRCEFVKTTIGVISNEFKKYSDSFEVYNSLIQGHNLAKRPTGSNYMIERLQLEGAVKEKEYNNKIWILEDDEALSYLLATSIELQGYSVERLNCAETIGTLTTSEIAFETPPAIIIIDAGSVETMLGLEICKTLRRDSRFNNTKLIMTSIVHNKELILNTGADLYLPKPYELITLMHWLKIFIKEVN